jgi:hypothetical protein
MGEVEHRERIYYGIPDVVGGDRVRYEKTKAFNVKLAASRRIR